MAKRFQIGNREVGEGCPCYVIAEMSCNHENDFDEAKRIVEAAAEAGADAIKIQTYTADTITRNFKADCGDTMWGDLDLYDLYDKAHTPWDWYDRLDEVAKVCGIDLFSSVFDETSVDYLVERKTPALKVSSFEIVDTKLLQKAASSGTPVIISNGMTVFQEIKEAHDIIRAAGCENFAILHCNSGYPPPFSQANLRTIAAMDGIFDCVIGLSDHTLFADTEKLERPMAHISPLESVKLGAKVIEVHLTMDRAKSKALFDKDEGGYDWAFSRDPAELKHSIELIRAYERGEDVSYSDPLEEEMAAQARGTVCFEPTEKEQASRVFRPVLWVVEDVKKGQPLQFAGGKPGNVDSIRGQNAEMTGLHVRFADFITGKPAARDLTAGTPLNWDMVQVEA
ncbi:MAG: N-acetylneuraminate synthase family protein [Rhodospirillales bacterium]|nr:N-acetylneuraminate synthase family protein [Rhodospirillales bacterium]MCB9995384.1 N-acetylneuraminate synthase family protein [Rhodospirillales bacterium]